VIKHGICQTEISEGEPRFTLCGGARRARQRRRSAGPFIPINGGAIPEGLVESELFGHETGAFTGTVSRKPGKVAAGGERRVRLCVYWGNYASPSIAIYLLFYPGVRLFMTTLACPSRWRLAGRETEFQMLFTTPCRPLLEKHRRPPPKPIPLRGRPEVHP
jgi:hypothetical protein